MDKKKIFQGIDFNDSEYRSCEISNKDVIVYLDSWDAKTLKVVFSNAIQFSCKLSDFPEGIYEVIGNSEFLNEALSLKYGKIPETHPYKLFQILDIQDFPFIEIVAESATAVKE